MSPCFRQLIQLEKNPSKKEKELSVWDSHMLYSSKGNMNTGRLFSELQKSFDVHKTIQFKSTTAIAFQRASTVG